MQLRWPMLAWVARRRARQAQDKETLRPYRAFTDKPPPDAVLAAAFLLLRLAAMRRSKKWLYNTLDALASDLTYIAIRMKIDEEDPKP